MRRLLRFYQEYPVLARQLVVCGDQWLAYTLEFLAHLSTDFSVLGAAFAPGSDIGMLTDVSSVGDRHRNGRSVLIAEFSSSLKLAYKPRSLSADDHFNDLLTWANERVSVPSTEDCRFSIADHTDGLNSSSRKGAHRWRRFTVSIDVKGGTWHSCT